MSLEHPRRLDELLNYRLARLLALSSAPGIRLFEGGYGVSRREWSLVGMVAVHGPMSPSELAALAHLDRSHVSRAITELVAKGLLARSDRPNDRRRAEVAITQAGRKLYEEVFPQVARINKAVLDGLTSDQLAAFDQALHLLTQSAEALVRTTPVTLKAARHLGSRR
jgi:DNA-binding MarR family transcriptional regulator